MHALKGQLIVLIGKLETPRTELEARLIAAGAKLAKDITRKTNLVVCGSDCATKRLKAIGMGVPLIEEQPLLAMLGNEEPSSAEAPSQQAPEPKVAVAAPETAASVGTTTVQIKPPQPPAGLTLAERLLVRIGAIARRSDVIVHCLRVGFGDMAAWASSLPPDMLAFYKRVNGLVFSYSFADDPESVHHGIRFIELAADGRTARERDTLRPTWPRARAGDYDEHVLRRDDGVASFGELAPDAETMALFFEGASDAAGHFLFGDASSARFGRWTNDGWARPLAGATFTTLVEDAIEGGLSWDPPGHRDRVKRVERLAKPCESRAPMVMHVRSRVELDERAARARLLEKLSKGQLVSLASALGRKVSAKSEREVILSAIHDGCVALPDADEARLAAVRAALPLAVRFNELPIEAVLRGLFVATGPVACVELEIEARLPALRTSSMSIVDVLALLDGARQREWVTEPLVLCAAPYGGGGDVASFRYGEVPPARASDYHPAKKTLLVPVRDAELLVEGTTIEAPCFGLC